MITPISSIGDGADSIVARLAPMPAPMSTLAPPAVEQVGSTGVGGFGAVLSRAVGGLVEQTANADRLQELAASGQLPDPTAAIVETQKADLSLRLAIQVRNRLLEGWQELNRTAV